MFIAQERFVGNSDDNNILVISLKADEQNTSTQRYFKIPFARTLRDTAPQGVILDFSEVSLLDSVEIAQIIYAWRYCNKKNIKLVLTNLSSNILSVLTQKGLHKLLDVFATVNIAIQQIETYLYVEARRNRNVDGLDRVFGSLFDNHMGVSDSLIGNIQNKVRQKELVTA